MPIYTQKLVDPDVTFARCEGRIAYDLCFEQVEIFHARNLGPGLYTFVVDMTPVTDVDMSFAEIRHFVRRVVQMLKGLDQSFRFEIATQSHTTSAALKAFELVASQITKRLEFHFHKDCDSALAAAHLTQSKFSTAD